MKVSFIIVTSSTRKFVEYDVKAWPVQDFELDKKINTQTNKTIRQILSLPLELEVIVVDNTGDFKCSIEDPRISILDGYGVIQDKGGDFSNFSYIKDIIEDIGHHTLSCSMSFNIGLQHVTGDYILMQHNDINYLFEEYGSKRMVHDAIELLESENYEYITVDKKPPKSSSPKGIEYFADCYWFLCRKDFYTKHKIWVDWSRGDTNHLATITCVEKKLKYLHLPGFYELDSGFEGKAWKEFTRSKGIIGATNIHYLHKKPFLEHFKGGTGLSRLKKEKSYNEN